MIEPGSTVKLIRDGAAHDGIVKVVTDKRLTIELPTGEEVTVPIEACEYIDLALPQPEKFEFPKPMPKTEPYLEPKRFPSMTAMAALLALGGGHMYMPFLGGNRRPKPELEEKPCRNCGKPSQHKKGFCSGDCCREYRAKK